MNYSHKKIISKLNFGINSNYIHLRIFEFFTQENLFNKWNKNHFWNPYKILSWKHIFNLFLADFCSFGLRIKIYFNLDNFIWWITKMPLGLMGWTQPINLGVKVWLGRSTTDPLPSLFLSLARPRASSRSPFWRCRRHPRLRPLPDANKK